MSDKISGAKKIIRNAAQCLDCGDIIESLYRHDFRVCSCDPDGIMVDGGTDYIRHGWVHRDRYVDLSVVVDD